MPSYTFNAKSKKPDDNEPDSDPLKIISWGVIVHQCSHRPTEEESESDLKLEWRSDGGNPNLKYWTSTLIESAKAVYLGVLYGFATMGLFTLVMKHLGRVQFDFDFSSNGSSVQFAKVDVSPKNFIALEGPSGLTCCINSEDIHGICDNFELVFAMKADNWKLWADDNYYLEEEVGVIGHKSKI
ncbi:hypothetical protein ACHAXS_007315 [Conticribra weissflogii]